MSTIAKQIQRVGSFKRAGERRSSRAERTSEPPPQEERRSSVVGSLVRSASFSRKKKGGDGGNGYKEPTSGMTSDGSSGQSSPSESQMDTADGPMGALHGWLRKRHCRDKTMSNQWSKRYFSVDDMRGTLSYSKGETRKASVILPLVDITSVKTTAECEFGFIISCPPVHLTVRADDREDTILWINGLRRRTKLWKEKQQANGYQVATMQFEDTTVGSVAHRTLPRDSCIQTTRTAPPGNVPAGARGPGTTDRTWSAEGAANAGRSPQGGRSRYLSGGEHEVNHTLERQRSKSNEFMADPDEYSGPELSMVETMEINSDDDDDEPVMPPPRPHNSPPHGSVQLEAVPRRDLADMLSSDEEDDDIPPAKAAVRRCAPAHCVDPLDSEPVAYCDALNASEAASATSAATATAPLTAQGSANGLEPSEPSPSSAAMPWLDAMPDTPLHADAALAANSARPRAALPSEEHSSPPRPAAAAPQRAHRELEEDWDADSGPDSPLKKASPAHEAHVPVGSGILADPNFVEDDWDDE